MSPFLAICARDVSGKPKRYEEERTQKLAPQNFKNSRFVSWELEMILPDIHSSMFLNYNEIDLIVNPDWISRPSQLKCIAV
jgi:hypothetical protein